jgi:protein phosphatase
LNSVKVSSFGHSDVGLVRKNNEDVYLQLLQHNLFLLADGMGGHNAGEVAAQETVVYLSSCIDKLLKQHSQKITLDKLKNLLESFIIDSNERIYQLGLENKSYQGMGTTLSALLFFEDKTICSHVGDSRIYRLRNNNLELLTSDHTLKNKLIEQGLLEKAIKEGIRYKNVLTKAIGAFKKIIPDITIHPTLKNDVFMMCSDGLSDFVTDEEIYSILSSDRSIKEQTFDLINKAKEKKSCDNITVLITRIE